MKEFIKVFIVAAALLLLANAQASACDPSGIEITPVNNCFLFCPAGDIPITFDITYNGDPLPYDMCPVNVALECIDGCINVCPEQTFPCYPDTSWAGSTHIEGEFSWWIKIGGCCPQLQVTVYLDGDPTPVYQVVVPVKSTDINCDGVVDDQDESTLIAAIGTNNYCADLNCDCTVDETDLGILHDHMGHSCEGSVGTENTNWGSIKNLFK